MRKKRPSRQHRSKDATAIVVENPNQVMNRILRAIRDALGNDRIGFEMINRARDEVKFELSGTPIRAMARESYAVFPLLQLEAELFWLGAALIFKRELGNYRLKSISVLVFKGEAFDERKTALFRAEWDDPEPGTIHAQPHWHVYPRLIESKESLAAAGDTPADGFDLMDFGIEGPIAEDPEWRSAPNFHYAMSSTWAIEGIGHHQANLTNVEDLVRWISSCIGYSQGQLRWLFT
jgi:hypothetical protein